MCRIEDEIIHSTLGTGWGGLPGYPPPPPGIRRYAEPPATQPPRYPIVDSAPGKAGKPGSVWLPRKRPRYPRVSASTESRGNLRCRRDHPPATAAGRSTQPGAIRLWIEPWVPDRTEEQTSELQSQKSI